MKKKIIALILFCTVFLMTGCDSFVDDFMSGWNEAESSRAEAEKNKGTDGAGEQLQPHSDEEVKAFLTQEALKSNLSAKLARFSGYGYKMGIPLNSFAKRDELSKYFDRLTSSGGLNIEKAYILGYEKKPFQDPVFEVKKPESSDGFVSLSYYVGEVNSKNQLHGFGLTAFVHEPVSNSSNVEIAIGYMGEFKNGKKDGYGIQFYIPDYFYEPDIAKQLAAEEVAKEKGLYKGDAGYDEALSEVYNQIFQFFLNIPTYEGEFKNNKFSGKGNFSSPYSYNMDEFDFEDVSSTWRILDCEILKKVYAEKDIFMMHHLYVGTFKNGVPDNAKCYENGTLTHDGKWSAFGEPK